MAPTSRTKKLISIGKKVTPTTKIVEEKAVEKLKALEERSKSLKSYVEDVENRINCWEEAVKQKKSERDKSKNAVKQRRPLSNEGLISGEKYDQKIKDFFNSLESRIKKNPVTSTNKDLQAIILKTQHLCDEEIAADRILQQISSHVDSALFAIEKEMNYVRELARKNDVILIDDEINDN